MEFVNDISLSLLCLKECVMENNRACIIIEPAHAIHEKKRVEVSVETTILFCQDQVLYWLQKRVLSNYKEPRVLAVTLE